MALPMHEKYKEMFSAVTGTAQKIGQALGPRRSRKAVDTGQYRGLTDTVRKNIPTSIKSLGTVTVKPGGTTRYEKTHPGIDIANIIGTQIPAFTRGEVSQVVSGQIKGSPGFGNYVIVTDQQGNKHRYSHLSQNYVKVGDPVYAGMPIGAMGATGQTYSLHGGTGSHLDYRIRDIYGKYLSPYQFIK